MLLKKELDGRISYACKGAIRSWSLVSLWRPLFVAGECFFKTKWMGVTSPQRYTLLCWPAWTKIQHTAADFKCTNSCMRPKIKSDSYIRDNFHKDQKLPVFGMCYMFYRRNMHLQSSHPHIHSNTFNQGVTVQLFHFFSASLQPKQSSQRNRFTSHSFSCRSYLSVGQLS